LKSDGNIFLAGANGRLNRITPKITGAFYHEVEWHDFNGDGLKDILTVRVNKIGFVPGNYDEGEMLWLENPGLDKFTAGEWKTHIITKGPDVIFKTTPYQGGLAIFCTEFFRDDPRISVRLLNNRGQQTASRIIDDNLGLPFAVNLADLDGDGTYELLATNHQDEQTEIKAAIFGYEIPWNDLINGQYPRHTLVYHPSTIKRPSSGVGAPGFAYAFYPKKGMTGPRHVVAAGDGNFDVWYLKPTGRGRFDYETQIIDFEGTTGELLLHDFDDDGIMDILVPDNDEWGLHGITFREGGAAALVASADCNALADLVVGGQDFGRTIVKLCESWPPSMGAFPIDDITRARELFEKVMGDGGAWDQIKQIRADKQDNGFCWRNVSMRPERGGECPLGYTPTGLTGQFTRSCYTGCMWSTHPVSCGFGCGTDRSQCNSAILDQTLVVAQGVASAYGFVVGDLRIGRATAAIISLAEFMLETLPPIIDAIQRSWDILFEGHGAYVAVVLFQYWTEVAPELGDPAEQIRDAIQEFGDIIAKLSEEKRETGSINPLTLIREILDHGEDMLDFAVKATKAFTHPTCAITDNVAFTIEVAGDDRLLGPWVQRGEIEGHPRYTLLGDRNTNLEWSNANGLSRWVMFSDNWSGFIGRRFLYDSSARSSDYPMSGWRKLQGDEPLPEFVPVQQRVE